MCTEQLWNPITTPHVSRAFINAIPVTQCPILDIPRHFASETSAVWKTQHGSRRCRTSHTRSFILSHFAIAECQTRSASRRFFQHTHTAVTVQETDIWIQFQLVISHRNPHTFYLWMGEQHLAHSVFLLGIWQMSFWRRAIGNSWNFLSNLFR